MSESNYTLQNNGVAWQEPDWDFLDYIDGLERQWKEDLRITLPNTESGWLEVFPEARAVLSEKIEEWEEVAAHSRVQIRQVLRAIGEKFDDKDRWFGRAVVKYTYPPVRDLAFANGRIKSLQWLLPRKNKCKDAAWQDALAKARGYDLISAAGNYGLRLRKAGTTFLALCPFHNERTPSFHIYPPSRFVCFGCDFKGDVITFVQTMDKSTFKEAVYKLQNI